MFDNVNLAISLENFLILKKLLHPTLDHVLIAVDKNGRYAHVSPKFGYPGENELNSFRQRIKEDILDGVVGGALTDIDEYDYQVNDYITVLKNIDNFINENSND